MCVHVCVSSGIASLFVWSGLRVTTRHTTKENQFRISRPLGIIIAVNKSAFLTLSH